MSLIMCTSFLGTVRRVATTGIGKSHINDVHLERAFKSTARVHILMPDPSHFRPAPFKKQHFRPCLARLQHGLARD